MFGAGGPAPEALWVQLLYKLTLCANETVSAALFINYNLYTCKLTLNDHVESICEQSSKRNYPG